MCKNNLSISPVSLSVTESNIGLYTTGKKYTGTLLMEGKMGHQGG
jgi:hypothetical protein